MDGRLERCGGRCGGRAGRHRCSGCSRVVNGM